MKVLIAVSCLLAVASASVVSPHVYANPYAVAYSGPQHLPVIGPNGVPVDEPAVQARRAEHAAAHVEAYARNGEAVVVGAAPVVAAAPVGVAYSGPQHLPVIGANGVPVDEPAVQARRAEHAAAYAEASARNGDAALVYGATQYAVPAISSQYYQQQQQLAVSGPLVAHPNGAVVPAESADIVAARANHLAAHAEVSTRNGVYAPLVHYRRRSGIIATPLVYGTQHLPIIGANGVPVDEPAVQVARAAHAAHYVEAHARNGDAAHSSVVAAPAAVAYGAPIAHVSYAGLQHLPVIGANGVPVDEPAVQVARAAHAAQYAEAQVRNGDAALVAHHFASPVVAAGSVVPAQTPDVAAARVTHLAAHVEARARNGIY